MKTPTREELATLFGAGPPRAVPPHVRERAMSVFAVPKQMVTMGVILGALGLVVLVLLPFRSSLPGAGMGLGGPGSPVLVGLVFLVVGCFLAWSAWRRRKGVEELLAAGRLVTGTVVAVKRSRNRTHHRSRGRRRSSRRMTRITVAFDGGKAAPVRAEFSTTKKSASKLARFAKEQTTPVEILAHSGHPGFVLVPAMMLASHHIGLALESGSLSGLALADAG